VLSAAIEPDPTRGLMRRPMELRDGVPEEKSRGSGGE
jgi:hypothetical protein